MGKGSRRRPTNEKKYAENYERVFGKRSEFPNRVDRSGPPEHGEDEKGRYLLYRHPSDPSLDRKIYGGERPDQ